MKIAVSGKGGVGKSTVTAALAFTLARNGEQVLAVDADPDANLASALGIPGDAQRGIVTIARHRALIEERTGAKLEGYGAIFSLNPEVADIAGRYAYRLGNVSLLVLGAAERGGGGCACPENTLLKALVNHLVLRRDETLLMDMEAGIEHLGRATAMGIDTLLVVTEPGQRSVDTVRRIQRMAAEIGIADLRLVLNRVRGGDEERFLRESLPDIPVLGSVPFREEFLAGDRDGVSVMDVMDPITEALFSEMAARLQK